MNSVQINHFHRMGFLLVPNPMSRQEMVEIEALQRQVEPEWEEADLPDRFNAGACQFLMMGELLLRQAERPQILEWARTLLECEDIHIGACGLGDASKIVASDGRPQRQVHWHADGGPEVSQVAVRTALDRHGSENGPLRILPGSMGRPSEEVKEELRQIELASGQYDQCPDLFFARHPSEIEVYLDPRWTLVWNPGTWHATGIKVSEGPRRAMSWNYFPAGGRRRDSEAVKHFFADSWRAWSAERQRLWGLIDD